MKPVFDTNDRLKHFRQLLGITQKQMADALGLNQPNIRDLESGRVKITTVHALALKEVYKLNPDWLMNGNGSMRLTSDFDENVIRTRKEDNNCTLDPDPSVNDLLIKTREVLASQTSYADSLKANINSFHEFIKSREEINNIRSEIDELKKHIVNRRGGEHRDQTNQDQTLESHQGHRTDTSGREESRGK